MLPPGHSSGDDCCRNLSGAGIAAKTKGMLGAASRVASVGQDPNSAVPDVHHFSPIKADHHSDRVIYRLAPDRIASVLIKTAVAIGGEATSRDHRKSVVPDPSRHFAAGD